MRIYGPVPSRRFGLSLGIDVVPMKSCTFDCIYCQLGACSDRVGERARFYPVDDIIADVSAALERGPMPDVLTLAGSGEPTLFSDLGVLLERLKSLASIPTLLITNSSLLWMDAVAEAAYKADILAPSLDAGDEETYRLINRPLPGFDFERLLSGLERVTHSHPGAVHLEVMLIDGVNDDDVSLMAIAERLKSLRYDRIDINTPVRPPMPERGAMPCSESVLARARALFGPKAHPIADFVKRDVAVARRCRSFSDRDKDIRETLLRRPCTVPDLVAALHLPRATVASALARLMAAGIVEKRSTAAGAFYHIASPRPGLVKQEREA